MVRRNLDGGAARLRPPEKLLRTVSAASGGGVARMIAPEIASYLRIEERELEAGTRNQPAGR